MEQYLMMCQPAANLQAMQFGVGGERTPGFAGRIEIEVIPFKPNIATTCYGMNDGNYKAITQETKDAFRTGTLDFIHKLKTAGTRVILLGSPGAVDTNSYNNQGFTEYNPVLAELSDIAREIAKSEGVVFVDVHSVMLEAMAKGQAKFGKTYLIAQDGIHPSPNGHLMMAYAFLKALGVSGDIGTLTVDFPAKTASATLGQEIKGFQDGTLSVESTRYPFCFTSDRLGDGSLGMTEFIPFNQELNRYLLIVKNAPAKTKVTWGATSKEYTAAQLAVGINLAADFPQNPFVEPFAKVSQEMQAQQKSDGDVLRSALNSLSNLQRNLPEGGSQYNELRELVFKKGLETRAAIKADIKPVNHQIKIESVL
jgi:lysophospholipase L1-like esterase